LANGSVILSNDPATTTNERCALLFVEGGKTTPRNPTSGASPPSAMDDVDSVEIVDACDADDADALFVRRSGRQSKRPQRLEEELDPGSSCFIWSVLPYLYHKWSDKIFRACVSLPASRWFANACIGWRLLRLTTQPSTKMLNIALVHGLDIRIGRPATTTQRWEPCLASFLTM
jgi:hypothetical protein